jgi:isoleucyl-tRNA synthetase
MYKKVGEMDFPGLEEEVLVFWRENDIFSRSLEKRKSGNEFVFYEGPPTANGKPHPGHVLTRAMKDLIPRYKTMCGYHVGRKGGWDTHGLPVELEVEKLLNISGKEDIEKFGVEDFIKKCKESVFTYKREWERMTERIGFWIDLENAYVTYTNEYIESVWWALRTIWDKGLLYKGHRVVPYCARCGTSLSSHEVAQGYEEVKEPSIFVKMRISGEDDTYFLVWTTTPWTLPSNVALAVSAKSSYSFVRVNGEILVLATELIDKVMEDTEYEIVRECKGEDLLNVKYEPILDFFADKADQAFYVVAGDFVTLDEGTGIVHIAPAFGEDDSLVGKQYNLPVIQPVNESGLFTEEVGQWEGMFVKEADPKIIEHLRDAGSLYRVADYTHTYPFCWRCDTPLLYYARVAWFIETTAIKDKLLENNKKIGWYPEHIRDGRFGNFLENVIDWSLSRERYWGTPLPIWTCECGYQHCVGSVQELRDMGKDVPEDIELHKPYIDNVELTCPKCGAGMKRVSEVIDCWFDAGSMPFAQWHYPFENKEIFENAFPANFISEAIDQTRGWFYTLLVISTLLFDESSFENCLVLGHVLDGQGIKMSKHKGNVVDPWLIFDNQGADPLRWYLYSVNPPWNPTRFYEEAVNETLRKFFGTLWNVYSFYVLYANIDEFSPAEYSMDVNTRPPIDRWLISKFNNLVTGVRYALDEFQITSAARSIETFVDDLSNWYVRRSRRRYWGSTMSDDKVAAYLTLYEVLVGLAKLLAPFIPFTSEEIYQNLVLSVYPDALESVHLCDYPEGVDEHIDIDLEKGMDLARDVVYLGRAGRNRVNIKNRQPLVKVLVLLENADDRGSLLSLGDLVKEELNVKSIEFVSDSDEFIDYQVKLNFAKVGPKYGKLVKQIASEVGAQDARQLVRTLRTEGKIVLDVNGEDIELSVDELDIRSSEKGGYCVESQGNLSVVLDTELTDELIYEGLARELVNKLQTMRKEAGFEIEDRIVSYVKSTSLVEKAISNHEAYIKKETLSVDLKMGVSQTGYTKEWDLNGEHAVLSVIRAD